VEEAEKCDYNNPQEQEANENRNQPMAHHAAESTTQVDNHKDEHSSRSNMDLQEEEEVDPVWVCEAVVDHCHRDFRECHAHQSFRQSYLQNSRYFRAVDT